MRPRNAGSLADSPARKKQKNWLMKLVSWLHLWPSLLSGVVVIFVCLTGTIIVYGDEIMDLTAGDAKYVRQVLIKKIDYKTLHENILAYNPNIENSELVFFKDPERSIRVRAFDTVANYLSHIYVDQYTGEVLKEDRAIYFFYVTAHLHADMSAGVVGGWIVVICTIIFLISCITGLVLWWPARWTKRTRQASFTVKWKAKFKRLNYDLHNVYGFYSLILCVILAFTGILIFFHPMGDAVIKMFGGSDQHLEESLPVPSLEKSPIDLIDKAYSLFHNEAKEKTNVAIWVYNLHKTGALSYSLGKAGLKSTENLDIAAFDKYTGEKLALAEAELKHEKVENIIWQLHMGQWWGQIGKFSTFLAGVIATSLSITGFLIWWARRKKKKKPKISLF